MATRERDPNPPHRDPTRPAVSEQEREARRAEDQQEADPQSASRPLGVSR